MVQRVFQAGLAVLLALMGSTQAIQVGDVLPDHLELHTADFPPTVVNLKEYVQDKQKKVLLIGLPGYLEHQNALKAAGVDQVLIYCVNDAAVMQAWAEDQKVQQDSLIQFFADPYSQVTRELDMELSHPGPYAKGLVGRCKRFAMVLDSKNAVVQAIQIAESPTDPAGDDHPENTCAPHMLEVLESLAAISQGEAEL